MNEAIDKVQIGVEKKNRDYTERRQKLVAYQQSGQALLAYLMDEFDTVNKISILPRDQIGGVTTYIPEEEMVHSGLYTKSFLLNKVCVGLGGRIAESIVFGEDNVTTGNQKEIEEVTNTARMMVERMGMSDVVGTLFVTK